MSEEDVEKMRKAHENYIYSIKVHAPKLIYKPNTRGVIATAGGSYLPVLVVSLRMLRRTGSTLPMEVFLASNREYESFICEHTLPSLNAKCVILSEILDNVVHEVEVAKYQLKAFAMLFSSFEEILFLDADSFPVSDPRHLFTSEPFKSSKLITWPDFWATSISGYYHRISNTPAIDTTVRATSEAGEVLISKRTHARTLLLATYYNYYGPHHYYPLLSQGGPGEGDKETFLYAAIALKEPFYDTSEKVLAIGHQYDWGLAGSAMVQYDPVADYALTSQKLFRNIDPACATSPRPLFVHVNFPKFNPGHIFDDRLLLEYAGNGTVRRVWTDEKETMAGFGGDVEKGYWEEIGWVACTLEGKFMDWVESGDVCVKARKYWTDLFGGVAPY
ncbi:hypothetical protein MMC19_000416 [Ptychographa xylographoides]|nr:hypothetical protein [Ptychographa xylographoides]